MASLLFTVQRHAPEFVKPLKPTPHEIKLLSDIDDQDGLRFQIPVIQFYKYDPKMKGKDPVDVIRKALAKTLVFYYPFAGRLREGPGRKLMVDCNDEGVLFIEADADVRLEQFGDALQPPFPCLNELLFDVPGSSEVLNTPLLLIQGGKIHATIRKQLLYMFQSKIEEGEVYEMSYFSVFPERGYYRTTLHPFKLIFQMKTKVKLSQSADISYHGLSLTDISEVCAHTHDYEFLVDVIGVMTGMSVVREYVRDGKMTKMVIIELTDHSGKCECALFGEYVDDLNKKFGKGHDNQPVVIIQFAKVKIFRDKTSIQNVMNTTRIFFNPDIPEYERFKNSIAVHGIETDSIVPLIGGVGKPSMADEFLNMHSKLRITELIENVEYGVFAVFGEVVRIVPGQQWWYAACKCHKAVIPDSGAYYCNGCGKHVFNIVPRFKVKVQVTDGENVCVFTIFDSEMSYMMEKSCAYFVAQSKVSDSGPHPIEFDGLIGKKMLFVVERGGKQSAVPDNSFRVRRMCIDPDIIGKFCAQGRFYTPTKVVDLDFEDASDDGGVDESSGAAGFVDDLIVVPSDVDSEPPNKGSAATTNKKRNGAARGASNGSKRSLCKAFDGVDKDVEKKTDKQIKIEKE